MKKYDVVVVGSDVTSLTLALYLARKMRKILVIDDPTPRRNKETLTDPENHAVDFYHERCNDVTGLDEGGLLDRYLHVLGLSDAIEATRCSEDIIVDADGGMRRRKRDLNDFRVYLIRYYPKQRDQIIRFFDDLERHHDNYLEQRGNMLENAEYTLTSLMIEWGDYSLRDLLRKYFDDEDLIEEFTLFANVRGLRPEEINSYNLFMNLFTGLYEGFYQRKTHISQLVRELKKRLKLLDENIIVRHSIDRYVTKDGTIDHVVTKDDLTIRAKYFVVAREPVAFCERHLPEETDFIDEMKRFFPPAPRKVEGGTFYFITNMEPAQMGIVHDVYHFNTTGDDQPQLLRLTNYAAEQDEQVVPEGYGAFCLEFACEPETENTEEAVLKRLRTVFPKLNKHIVAVKEGPSSPIRGLLAKQSVRKNLSINRLIDIENFEHLILNGNTFFAGDFLRPEAGLFGMISVGVSIGDNIEEKLYYGENDDSFYYLSNDEIMMMIRHNYVPGTLGKKEFHVNFHIGKSTYFIRAKNKNIMVYQGLYDQPELSIYATNDVLSNLVLKKMTFDEALASTGFKYMGDEHRLTLFSEAFNLDDYQEPKQDYRPMIDVHNLGIKMLFAHLLIWGVAAFLSNFFTLIWILPFALGLSIGLIVFKNYVFSQTSVYEYIMAGMLAVLLGLALIWPNVNRLHMDDPLLGAMGLMLLVSWFAGKPLLYDFHKFDQKRDYASTKLFKIIMNGLTLVWAVIFLGILAFTYVSGERYVSAWYHLIFLGIFLTYYYPVIYVKTNIKK